MRLRPRGSTTIDADLCAELARSLAAAPSGVAFVYDALDRMAEESGGDCVLVLHEPLVGRQVFRAHRRPLEGSWAERVAGDAAPGIYYENGAVDRDLTAGIMGLCTVAVRLDVVGHDASHDPLTGLLNRRSFDEALDAAVAQSRRYGWQFALALIDVRGPDTMDDTNVREPAGNDVLRALGGVLRADMRAGDVVARVGGHEFGLILPNSAPALLPRLVDRLAGAVDAAAPAAGAQVSIGVARAPMDATEPDALYRLARERLYEPRAVG